MQVLEKLHYIWNLLTSASGKILRSLDPFAVHESLQARAVKYFRTQEAIKVFKAAHQTELAGTPINEWPYVKARQAAEIGLMKAGQFKITERRSWNNPFLPQNINRMAQPLAKNIPYNLRRISRTPIPRRCINAIKNAVCSLQWDVEKIDDVDPVDKYQDSRILTAKHFLSHPNNDESFRVWLEKCIEDFLIAGAFVSEMTYTGDYKRPLKLWAVNAESIRIFASWQESNADDQPRYAQMTGLKGERGALLFYSDDLLFIVDNPSTDSPYGTSKMEIAFSDVNALLGVQRMAARAASNQSIKQWLWWDSLPSDHLESIRRQIQSVYEGQGRSGLIAGAKKPDIIEMPMTNKEDLLLEWQEMLFRTIAAAFDLSALAVNVERDVNRSTSEVLDDKDFQSAVVPLASRLQEAFTRNILHGKLGWVDLRFRFQNLNEPNLDTRLDTASRLWTTSSVTSNDIREMMRLPKREDPFYDLTQGQLALLNIAAQTAGKNTNAQFSSDLQMKQAQQYQQMYGTPASGGNVAGAPTTPTPKGSAGGGGDNGDSGGDDEDVAYGSDQTAGSTTIPGTLFSAHQIAAMTTDQLCSFMVSGMLPKASKLIHAMEQQPGVFNQMAQEARMFLEQVAKEEKTKPRQKVSKAVLNQWQKVQSTRARKQAKQMKTLEELTQKFVGSNVAGKNPTNRVKNILGPGQSS